jgi:hypothetical protein
MVEQATGAQANGAATAGDPAVGEVDGGDELTGLRRALDEERKQRRTSERRIKELEAAQQQTSDATKSDVERLTADLARVTAERDQLSSAARQRKLGDAVATYVDHAGARRPATVARLILDEVEVGEDGVPTPASLKAAVDGLRRTDPDLFRSVGSADGAARGVGAGAGGGNDMNAILRRAAGRA